MLTWQHEAEDAGRQQVGVGAIRVLVVVIHPDGVLLPPAAGVRRRLEPLPDAPAEARRPDHRIDSELNTQSERGWQALRKLVLHHHDVNTMPMVDGAAQQQPWAECVGAQSNVKSSAPPVPAIFSTARPVVAGLATEEGERVALTGQAALQRAGRKLLRVVDRRQQQVLHA